MKHRSSYSLNARRMTTREEAHAHLKERLKLPDWYGNNLDALYDCLSEIGEPTRIVLHFAAKLAMLPDGYGEKLIRVLRQAAEENPNIKLSLHNRI
ncbi:MAG TPA: barstar family protein [Clostridia bacterium]|nr:barstar family protein [Clostridia bacterium]